MSFTPDGLVKATRERLKRLQLGAAVAAAMGRLGAQEMLKAGVLEPAGPTGILEWLYRVYFALVFVVVVLLPTYPEEPFFYFPAILALASAWLLAMPMYGQALLATDFTALRPSSGLWSAFLQAIEKHVPVPSELKEKEVMATMETLVPKAVPSLIPVAVLQLGYRLAWRATLVGLVGVIGVLLGPTLARLHWWRGWSPVSFLYAVSMPATILLLVSLIGPMIIQVYLASRISDRALSEVVGTPPADDLLPENRTGLD